MKNKPSSVLSALLSLSVVVAPWPASATVAHIARPVAPATPVVGRVALTAPLAASRLSPATLSAPAFTLTAPLAPAPRFAAPADAPAANAAASVAASPAAAAPAAAAPAAASAPSDAAPSFLPDDAVRGKTVVMVGTKGSRPFIMEEAARVAKELGITLVLVDDAANRANSAAHIPDSHFIAAPIGTRSRADMDVIAQAVSAHPVAAKAEAVVGFMSLYAALTGKVTDKLGAKGIPGDAVSAADDKPEARRRLNAVAGQEVPFAELETEADARAAYRAISDNGRYKVVIKTNRGENSRFLALGLESEEAAAAAFLKMDAEVEAFTQRPEAAHTTFATHPGLMMERMLEKAPGSEETSVEAVMQNGRLVSAMVSDTMGIGENGRLAGGLLVFPSQQGAAVQQALVEATEKALLAMGIRDGNARLDLMVTPDGARVVEVNPLMGGVAIWAAVKSLTGMSLVEQGLRAVLGLKVDPGHAADGVVHYLFTASGHTGKVERVSGMDDAKAAPGVVVARSFVSEGDTIAAAGEQAYEEWGEVIGKGRDWREAITNAVEGARRMVLTVRKDDGTVVEQRGDHLQPTAEQLAGPARGEAPPLLSKVVLGFLSTFLLVSTVVESTSLAVSAMTQPLTAGFLALAALTSVSYGAYTIGSFLGGSIIKRFGIRASYRAVLFARTAVWTTIALLFNPVTGTVALPALIALFSLDYFFHSIGRVAEHSLQVAWYKDSEAASSRFGSFRDFIEYGTVFVGSAMALLVAAYGFGAVVYPAPFAFGLAALVALMLALPKAGAEARKPAKWNAGLKTVFQHAGIYKPLLGFALVNSFLYMMYYIVATAFGAYATTSPEAGAAVAGSLTGVYGLGALLGALVMDRLATGISKRVAAMPEGEQKAGERRLYSLSAAKILPWAAAALLGSWLLVTNLQIGTLLWPMFPVSLALLAIGFTAQMASNHLDTIMKANIPKGEKDMAVGAIRALIYFSHVVGFILWGGLFALFGTGAFALFAAFYTAVAGVYVWLARDLKRGL